MGGITDKGLDKIIDQGRTRFGTNFLSRNVSGFKLDSTTPSLTPREQRSAAIAHRAFTQGLGAGAGVAAASSNVTSTLLSLIVRSDDGKITQEQINEIQEFLADPDNQ